MFLLPHFFQVDYMASTKAWFNQFLATEWFHKCFVPSVYEYQTTTLKRKSSEVKAVLLWDNAPAHPVNLTSECGRIKTQFLPPNSTALIQPQDQGIISALKRAYRKIFVSKCLQVGIVDEVISENALVAMKKYNIADCIFNIATAWNQLSKDTLSNCWHKLMFDDEFLDDGEHLLEEEEDRQFFCDRFQLEENEIEEWLYNDTEEVLTFEEIAEAVSTEPEEEESETEITGISTFNLKLADVIDGLDTALKYFSLDTQSDELADLHLNFYNQCDCMRKHLFQLQAVQKKQTKVTDFFKVRFLLSFCLFLYVFFLLILG